MRSLGSRRARIVGEIVGGAARRGLRALNDPRGPIAIFDPTGGSAPTSCAQALPLVGLPTAERVFEATQSLTAGGNTVRLVYDGIGVSPGRGKFLAWLDRQVPDFRCATIAEIDDWLGGL
jgi:hypothetical protein